MKLNKFGAILKGASGDSFFLMLVRMVTLVISLLIIRVLSEHFSLQDYGTYSQVTLLITTITSLTILGMMDGINFFFCKEKNELKRDAYVSTIFVLQFAVNAIASLVVLIGAVPITKYFGNDSLKPLLGFVAVVPVMSNTISLLQIMFIAIGKARQIAIRNFIISVVKLAAVALSCYVFDSIAVIFICQIMMEILQIVYFVVVLNKNNCKINFFKFDKSLVKEILLYCIPMAMFVVIKSLNRDADKYVISFFTNTETLAVYSNASKILPLDIVMTSFCTVLVPHITRYIANRQYEECQTLYKSFLELSYITTTILAVGAVCVAPELMRFLYSEKYSTAGFSIPVFVIYILVDIVMVINITLILSAAGKTKTILYASIGTFVANIVFNILSFFALREVGPALTTLVVTTVQGIVILSLGAKEIKTNILKMFDFKYLLRFIAMILVATVVAMILRKILVNYQLHYMIILIAIFGVFAGALLLLNKNRLLKNVKIINSCKANN